MEKQKTIGFIGAGNMAKAIIKGMLGEQLWNAGDILASRRSKAKLEELEAVLGIRTTTDNVEVVKKSDIIFLAVKPQMLSQVIKQISPYVREEQLLVSIAAGKSMEWIEKEFAKKIKLVRTMPNTPAMAGEGCTSICANANVSREEAEEIKKIFDSCGTSYEIPESLMDVAGALSGSTPAFVFQFMEAMADAAVLGGMPRELAYKMAAQTVLGSGKLMLETGQHPGALKDMVCSPGGTTICGVRVLEERGMRGAVMGAIDSCIQKSKKI